MGVVPDSVEWRKVQPAWNPGNKELNVGEFSDESFPINLNKIS